MDLYQNRAIGWFDDEWYEEGFSAWMDEIADFMEYES